MRLTKKQKELLQDVKEHWYRMLKWAETRNRQIKVRSFYMKRYLRESWYKDDCAFCRKYYYDNCKECPIKIVTGKKFCLGTNWDKIERSKTWQEWIENTKIFIQFLDDIPTLYSFKKEKKNES